MHLTNWPFSFDFSSCAVHVYHYSHQLDSKTIFGGKKTSITFISNSNDRAVWIQIVLTQLKIDGIISIFSRGRKCFFWARDFLWPISFAFNTIRPQFVLYPLFFQWYRIFRIFVITWMEWFHNTSIWWWINPIRTARFSWSFQPVGHHSDYLNSLSLNWIKNYEQKWRRNKTIQLIGVFLLASIRQNSPCLCINMYTNLFNSIKVNKIYSIGCVDTLWPHAIDLKLPSYEEIERNNNKTHKNLIENVPIWLSIHRLYS